MDLVADSSVRGRLKEEVVISEWIRLVSLPLGQTQRCDLDFRSLGPQGNFRGGRCDCVVRNKQVRGGTWEGARQVQVASLLLPHPLYFTRSCFDFSLSLK